MIEEYRIPKKRKGEPSADQHETTPILGSKLASSHEDQPRSPSTVSHKRQMFASMSSPGDADSSTVGVTNSIAMVSTVLSKSIPMVSEVTRESIMELEADLITYENSNKSASINHWDYFSPESKLIVKGILRREHQSDKSMFRKQKWEDFEVFDREFLFSLLKRFAPEALGKSTGNLTIADRFMLLKYEFDVFKGPIDTQRYVQQVITLQLTCEHEIASQESSLVKILIDNMATDQLIQKRLKSLVKIKNPKSLDEFTDALTEQAKYLTNVVSEAVSYLGVNRGIFTIGIPDRDIESAKDLRPMKHCNGCGSNHGGSCMLSKHPNFNNDHESINWKDSEPGKALAILGYKNLPWNKQMVKNKSTGEYELVQWLQAPSKPMRNKEQSKKFKKN